jgi:AcrR family transcriptional regulator
VISWWDLQGQINYGIKMNQKRSKKIKITGEKEPMLSIREEQKRVTYERLLNAAKELFETAGADGVTIDQIARRAGTNRTTFYLHFEDKAHIAFKIRTQYMELDINHISRFLLNKKGVTRNDISRWIKTRAKTFRKLKTVIEIGSESLHRKPELMQEFLLQTNEIVVTAFRDFLIQFEPDEQELLLAELFLGGILLNRYLYITVIQGLKFPPPKVPEALVNYWYNLLSRKPGKKG